MIRSVKIELLVIALLFSRSLLSIQAKYDGFDAASHAKADEKVMIYQTEERYPQTIIHEIVSTFLRDESNEKAKKVLVLGYDGYREDMLIYLKDNDQSAITMVMREGGLYHSYAGANGNQDTSTAPGWLSILSGTWAYKLGVTNNEGRKPEHVSTFLDEAVALGYASTFVASWNPHFSVTYQEDITHPEGKAVYQQMRDDEETAAVLQEQLANTSPSSYDVVFATLEYTDHAGHTSGYGKQMDAYVKAAQQADEVGYALLQTIQERATYYEEDWLIIITTDHGGYGNDHGGTQADEVNTWFAVNKQVNID